METFAADNETIKKLISRINEFRMQFDFSEYLFFAFIHLFLLSSFAD